MDKSYIHVKNGEHRIQDRQCSVTPAMDANKTALMPATAVYNMMASVPTIIQQHHNTNNKITTTTNDQCFDLRHQTLSPYAPSSPLIPHLKHAPTLTAFWLPAARSAGPGARYACCGQPSTSCAPGTPSSTPG